MNTDKTNNDWTDSDVFRALKEEKQQRHNDWNKSNMEVLNDSGLSFKVASRECVLFREEGKPKVDFYPSTGRWKVDGKMYRGGARSFINWYSKK